MQKIAVVDFGGQYAHLLANKIRKLGVYSQIVQNDVSVDSAKEFCGIVFSGGPHSVYEENAPRVDENILKLGVPILGICYGHHLIARLLGGEVEPGKENEYGISFVRPKSGCALFDGLSSSEQMWMSHGDAVKTLPQGFESCAKTDDCETAAMQDSEKKIFGVQFHPEVVDSLNGLKVLDNFLSVCGAKKDWSAQNFFDEIARGVLHTVADKKVFLLVSGGVDSTVAFALLNRVLGREKVLGLHIDNGLMREGESADIIDYMKDNGFDNLRVVDAGSEFLSALKGVAEPEKKREIIGNMFLEVKSKAQNGLGLNENEWILAQGTIYPDTIESAGTKHASRIKTHHNRVDIILELLEKGLVVEPLAALYKDEVRSLGESIGVPHKLLWRHPFPGPGLGVRCLCSGAKEDETCAKTVGELSQTAEKFGYSAVQLPIRSVGVQGDARTYAKAALLFGKYDFAALETASTAITNRIKTINRVVFSLFSECEDKKYRIIEGYCTKERLDKLRKIDKIANEAVISSGEYEKIWQMPVVLLPLVNSNGNETAVLRPVVSNEAMTARFYNLSQTAVDEIIKKSREVCGIGDIFLDISHKPPGTIEWE